ncbi:MAG: phospho-sugar mutase [Firmicutes bacterium]|nr:phospho-sugar mutase [Bacillota bacterium]
MDIWEINFRRWLDEEELDADIKKELKMLSEKRTDAASREQSEAEIRERFEKELKFGTGGLRGLLGAGTNRINVYTVRRTTQGLCDYITEDIGVFDRDKKSTSGKYCCEKGPSVVIGYDSRRNSRTFAEAAAGVFTANGIKVYMFGDICPVPAVSFAVRKYGCLLGVMITASHNPAEYNGYKVYNEQGAQITDSQARRILRRINDIDIFDDVSFLNFESARKTPYFEHTGDDLTNEYIDAVMKCAVLWTDNEDEAKTALRALSVVYSPLNGAGNKPVREVFTRLGVGRVDVVKVQENPDENFTTCPYPNPEKEESMHEAFKLARKVKPDIVIVTDPDCDRVGVAVPQKDGEYRRVTGNEIGLLMFLYIAECRRIGMGGGMPKHPAVARTTVTSSLIDRIAEKYGIEIKKTPTGFKYIGEFMHELDNQGRGEDFIFGLEESCSYLAGSYVRDKDGVSAAALICLMTAKAKVQGLTLFEAIDKIYKEYGYTVSRLINFKFDVLSGMEKTKEITESFRRKECNIVGDFPDDMHNDICRNYGGSRVTEIKDYLRGIENFAKADMIEYHLENGAEFTVRPSGTEPKLKIYISASGKSMEEAETLCMKIEDDLKNKVDYIAGGSEYEK